MKKLLCVLNIFLILALTACGSAQVSGKEIKGLDKLNENSVIHAIGGSETNLMVYGVEKEDVLKFRDLFIENEYTKEPDAKIDSELFDKSYTVTAELEDGENLHITVFGGEYIYIEGQFDDALLKINKPDFEKQFKEILWIE